MESIFVSCYLKRVADTGSVLCIELNPSPEYVPPSYRQTGKIARDIERYLFDVIEVAARIVPVVEFQMAYYSALGGEGENVLERLIRHAQNQGLLVILDVNQADIGGTVEQYGNEVFGRYGADACTFPSFEITSNFSYWMKWLERGHMVISMIQASNLETPSIQDLELPVSGLNVYEMATRVAKWNAEVTETTDGAGGVGAVVKVTWPEQVVRYREFAGDDVFFLIPDYGVQGGGADRVVGGLSNSRGQLMGAVNNGSIFYNWRNEDKKPRKGRSLELAETVIKALNADLNVAIERKLGKSAL